MKYEIDTIPVWDALRAQAGCPLCLLERRSRQAALRYYLGPSVMVPEVRVEVNRVGFRPSTLRLLAKDPNKLGLALLSHTRLKAFRARLADQTRGLRSEAAKMASKGLLEGLSGARALKERIAQTTAFLRDEEARCLVEAKIAEDGQRYAFTLVHLWSKDQEFRRTWAQSTGACLRHTPDLLDRAAAQLGGSELGAFVSEFFDILEVALEKAEVDVLAFTQTFDSTHSHTIVGNPQGALDRALAQMAGVFPEYEDEAKTRKGPLMGTVTST